MKSRFRISTRCMPADLEIEGEKKVELEDISAVEADLQSDSDIMMIPGLGAVGAEGNRFIIIKEEIRVTTEAGMRTGEEDMDEVPRATLEKVIRRTQTRNTE